MPFVEVFSPPGSLAEDRVQAISERLVAEVMTAEGAPDTEAARAISWLVWHAVPQWWVGGKALTARDESRYVVRISVPGGSLDDSRRAEMVSRVTRVLAEADGDGDRLYRDPVAWVQIVEIPDGNWGARGEVVRLDDIIRYATESPVVA